MKIIHIPIKLKLKKIPKFYDLAFDLLTKFTYLFDEQIKFNKKNYYIISIILLIYFK